MENSKNIISISLPGSKSISNRLLLIREIGDLDFNIKNLSNSDDTNLLVKAIKDIENDIETIDIGLAGTDLRFLCAYLSIKTGHNHILTGSDRIQKRPISELVNCLKKLGADIAYTDQEGYAPLRIKGKELRSIDLEINAGISSQFISALALIAPALPNGLKIQLTGKKVSKGYVEMTLYLMKEFGIDYSQTESELKITAGKYFISSENYFNESDWSAASYFYECLSLGISEKLFLQGLIKNSLQPDSCLSDIFVDLGVTTEFTENGVVISKNDNNVTHFEYDFTNCPDIAQTVIVTCFAKGITCKLTGLSTLKSKETDRIFAMTTELSKLGGIINCSDDFIEFSGKNIMSKQAITINTYEDHRMAMCFAPLAILHKNITIHEPEVVSKSFPGFWAELSKLQ